MLTWGNDQRVHKEKKLKVHGALEQAKANKNYIYFFMIKLQLSTHVISVKMTFLEFGNITNVFSVKEFTYAAPAL